MPAGRELMNTIYRHQSFRRSLSATRWILKRNSCIFEGNGQMVTFRILCAVKSESENELTLVYGRSLSEMNSLSQSLQRSPSLVKLYRHNGKYYLQSPCIVDRKGRANVKVACEKLKASN